MIAKEDEGDDWRLPLLFSCYRIDHSRIMTTKSIQNEQTSYLRCVLRIMEIHYLVLKVLDNYGTDDSRLFICLLSSLLMAALNLGDAFEPKNMHEHIDANYFNSFFDSLCFFGTKKTERYVERLDSAR
jgi:hypothetical protein